VVLASVGRGYFDLRGAMYDVAVRENEAVGSENKARTGATRFSRRARPVSIGGRLVYFDIDDGGAYSLGRRDNCSRICVEQFAIAC
jgi:hypothetical protein